MTVKNLCFHMGYAPLSDTNYGSEISLLNLAQQFNRYYSVVIFSSNCQKEEVLQGGIKYLHSHKFEEFTQSNEIDILIISRYLNVFIDNTIKANKIYIWVHDVGFQSYIFGQQMRNTGKHLYDNISHKIDGTISLSDVHKMLMMNQYGIPENKIHSIGYGIDVSKTNTIVKNKHKFIYTSCPSRGLNLLLKIFPIIRSEFEDVELFIYREITTFSKEQIDTINTYDYIHIMGFHPNEKIKEAFQSSGVWLYPTNFVETFCMSALEAQAGGCLCITNPIGSLVEIVGNRGILIEECEYGSDEYIQKVLKNIRVYFHSDLYDNKVSRAKEWANNRSWESICKIWLKLFGDENIPYKESLPIIPTFVINLFKQPQKWEKCKQDLLSIGFNEITRVEAIDGETLVWGDELKKYFILHEDSYKWIPHSNNAGIFGCALSHVKLWEKLAECCDETVWMIVEDDMVPNNNFGNEWTGIYNSIKDDKNWDICYLGYLFFGEKNILSTDKVINDNVYQLVKTDERMAQNCGGTICYILRASGAKKILKLVSEHKIHRAIDWFLIDFYDKICAYITFPLLVHPRENEKSTIQGSQKTILGINNELFHFVEKVVYINLDFRTDRRAEIEKECQSFLNINL